MSKVEGPYKVAPTVDQRLPQRWRVISPDGQCVYVGHTPMGAQVEADILNTAHAHGVAQSAAAVSELVGAIDSAVPFMQDAWKVSGIGGMFEVMDHARTIAAKYRTAPPTGEQ